MPEPCAGREPPVWADGSRPVEVGAGTQKTGSVSVGRVRAEAVKLLSRRIVIAPTGLEFDAIAAKMRQRNARLDAPISRVRPVSRSAEQCRTADRPDEPEAKRDAAAADSTHSREQAVL